MMYVEKSTAAQKKRNVAKTCARSLSLPDIEHWTCSYFFGNSIIILHLSHVRKRIIKSSISSLNSAVRVNPYKRDTAYPWFSTFLQNPLRWLRGFQRISKYLLHLDGHGNNSIMVMTSYPTKMYKKVVALAGDPSVFKSLSASSNFWSWYTKLRKIHWPYVKGIPLCLSILRLRISMQNLHLRGAQKEGPQFNLETWVCHIDTFSIPMKCKLESHDLFP